MSTPRTSLGALRQAQFSVTSSQPEGSASPIGIRQLKTQGACDFTAGKAVIVYGGEVSTDDEDAAADIELLAGMLEVG